MKKKFLATFIAAVSCAGTFTVSSIPLTSIAEKAAVEQSVGTESPLKDYADAINEYLRSNSVSGYAYIQDYDATEKLLITYYSDLEKIKAYITDLGVDENLVLYSQNRDDSSVSKLSGKIVSLPDKLEYKLGEQIDLTGIKIEAANGNEKAVVYTYPDVAFDYQSNIPKPATILLSTDFRGDKAGTYKVEALGLDNISFDVKVVNDSALSDTTETTPGTSQSTMITTEVSEIKGDSNCDGQVNMSDDVMIMQALANPNKYGIEGTEENHLTEQGKLNGDMNGDGLTVGDAQEIQRKLLGLN